MPRYRLLSTRRNPDGSVELPSLDERFTALDDQTAALRASRFPLGRFIDQSDFAWLVNEAGVVVWTTYLTKPMAA